MKLSLYLLCITVCQAYDRLKQNVLPRRYHLSIQPDMDKLTFAGHVNIGMMISMNDTDTLFLDCDEDLKIIETKLINKDFDVEVNHTYSRSGDRLKITTERVMKPNFDMELSIRYNGTIRGPGKDLSGFYYSTFNNSGIQRHIASTQFAPLSARKAFPCFDEPSFRANFSLQVRLAEPWNAIGNTPKTEDLQISNGTRVISFATKPNMPVYLAAWVIYQDEIYGHQEHTVNTTCGSGSNVTYRVWSNKEYSGNNSMVLNVASDVVRKLENFTGITCKAVTDKVDLVAVPDFSYGAMENWGLITFREIAILLDDTYSTALDKQNIMNVVTHELVHQWFGNLVTPDWWSYVWLSEGFARYLQFFILHESFPEFRFDEQFLIERRQYALEEDNSLAHPITNEHLITEGDIEDMFDVITYDKGASVIHMMKSSTQPPEDFKIRIQNYLKTTHSSGGVATADSLFSQFDNLPPNMNLWANTNGYPIIIATESNNTLKIKQIKLLDWNKTEHSAWPVPITIQADGNLEMYWLQENTLWNYTLPNDSYIINVNQTGYYRVLYENPSRWKVPIANPVTRSQLIDDSMWLAYAGLIPYSVAFDTAEYHLSRDTDYITWKSGLRAVSRVISLPLANGLKKNIVAKMLSLMENVINYIAFNDTTNLEHIQKLHQMNILRHSCNFGHKGCDKEVEQLSLNISSGSPEKRSALLCSVVKRGNSSVWESVLSRYKNARSPAEAVLMLKSLTCTNNDTLTKRLLNLLFTDAVRRQDVVNTIGLISSSISGADITFTYFMDNIDNIYQHFGEMRSLRKIMKTFSKYITEGHLTKLKQIILPKAYAELKLTDFIRSSEKSLSWRNNAAKQLTLYLKGPEETVTTSVHPMTHVTTEKPDGGKPIPSRKPGIQNASGHIDTRQYWTQITFLLCLFISIYL